MDHKEKETFLLTPEQSYRAMFLFILDRYKKFQGEELADLLSDTQIRLDSGIPLDPASWQDWMICVRKVMDDSSDTPDKPWIIDLYRDK